MSQRLRGRPAACLRIGERDRRQVEPAHTMPREHPTHLGPPQLLVQKAVGRGGAGALNLVDRAGPTVSESRR